jgi:hypothetical protein
MVRIIRIKDPQYYPPHCWDMLGVLSQRRDLCQTEPLSSDKITELDLWLVKQPDVPSYALVQIWARAMYIFLDIYLDPDADDESKHYALLGLKAHYQEYKSMPQRVQDLLAPLWGSWHAALLIEWEECRGAA